MTATHSLAPAPHLVRFAAGIALAMLAAACRESGEGGEGAHPGLVMSQAQLKAGRRHEHSQPYAALPAGARVSAPARFAARFWASSSSLAFRSQRSL